jgi:predicted ATPase
MHISRFKISNYKSFRESREVELEPGFNVIVGKNNSGKTALIEALSLDFSDEPHRSQQTIPRRSSTPPERSEVEAIFSLKGKEIREILIDRSSRFRIPRENNDSPVEAVQEFKESLSDQKKIEATFNADGISSARIASHHYDSNGSVRVRVDSTDSSIPHGNASSYSGQPNVSRILSSKAASRVYAFDAQRMNVGSHGFSDNTRLNTNATNLPVVLNVLQSNKAKFERYNAKVREIFPHIEQIRVEPSGNQLEINVWNIDPATERDDLAVPLSESGTGIGQVLAMLYVVLTADRSRTIIIDEPQSFLHPGAVRRLISIMKQHPKHQYIVTTHAPSVITAADPSTLLLTRLEGMESKIETLDVSEAQDLQRTLAEVGARLSDVFGADNILWVEGRTEEECFPMILEEVAEEPLLGTQIIGVRHTGDFESEPKEVVALYRKLSEGRGLRPPAVGFIFDREDRDEQELTGLRRRDDRIQFTKRRMYENYLVNPEAIAAVLSDLDRDGEQYSDDEVQKWLEEHGDEFDTGHEYDTKEWTENVHAANLLEELFTDLSDTRVPFDKVRHAPMLTEWIIEHSPEELREIADLLADTIEHGRERQDAGDLTP